jgi:hypothetical protein
MDKKLLNYVGRTACRDTKLVESFWISLAVGINSPPRNSREKKFWTSLGVVTHQVQKKTQYI